MSFLYPLFLIAGVSLAIPVLIHLFNLRRYKTVYFPHTRFLKNIQLNSRRQSEVRYKLLLAARLLFLASLILAFAQPFFTGNDKKDTGRGLKVIYIDNSGSMTVKKGARSLLDIAKESARKQLQKAHTGSRFILLTNDKPYSYKPIPADKVLTEINNIEPSAGSKTSDNIFSTVNGLVQSEVAGGADVFYYSDFQKNSFTAKENVRQMQHIAFTGIPVQGDASQNIYIDTAYLNTPVLQTGQSNKLVVRSRIIGAAPKDMPVIQLSVNGQVKSAATPSYNDKNESIDTLNFSVNGTGWQNIMLTLNDASVRFDDTFRISARSAPGLSVLVLNENQPNPYIQAAFRANEGFRVEQLSVNAAPADLTAYNLVILNGITHIDDALAKTLNNALQLGQSICLFPGMTNNTDALNAGLKTIGDIRFIGLDTASQAASSLQQGSDLVKDMFESIPENVQLPVATRHYTITAGLSANQQSVLCFRNGDPFLARYTPSKGQLYICATSADQQSGNFPGSYFFVPFLYQMAMQSRGGDIYALTIGKQQAAFIPMGNAGERNMVHLYADGIDAIPPQRPNGSGLDVFIDQTVPNAGFYRLGAAGGDTAVIALNQDRSESRLDMWDINTLKKEWKGAGINWMNADETGSTNPASDWGGFPLWKVCVILALIMLAAETFLLAGGLRKTTAAT